MRTPPAAVNGRKRGWHQSARPKSAVPAPTKRSHATSRPSQIAVKVASGFETAALTAICTRSIAVELAGGDRVRDGRDERRAAARRRRSRPGAAPMLATVRPKAKPNTRSTWTGGGAGSAISAM